MPVMRPDRPAHAEAVARSEPVRRVHAVTLTVVVVGLVVTAALVAGAAVVHDNNEDRLLQQRGHEAATVAASSISGLQGQMAAASIAAEADAPGGDTFRRLMGPLVARRGGFVSASVWPLDQLDPQPSTVVGAPPGLATASASTRRSFLEGAAGRTTISVRDVLGAEPRRLGYAFAVPGASAVAYVESALPENRRARIASDSAFADLDYALYLGDRPTPTKLLASSSGSGLRGGRTASDTVPFGDTKILLVVSPHGDLGGGLLAALPWVLGAIGVLLTLVAAFLTERLIRRRERAEELSRRLEEVADENAALYASQRDIAEQLQRSLMPQSLPHFPGLESAARYQAGVVGTEVGGDWYDVLPIAEDRVVFSVGDVVGRGLAAAVLMASLRYAIRAYALEQSDPATILDKLSTMVETTADDRFATVICGVLDATEGTLTVARAGHPDLLVVDSGGAHFLDAPLGPPVGVDPDWSYESIARTLPADAVLLAYTDGLVERRREHLDLGLERLRVAALADLPVTELVPHVVDTLVGDDAADDVAVLGLHWTATRGERDQPAPRVLALDCEPGAARTARRFVREALAAWEVPEAVEVAELLSDELVSNVVCHVGSPMVVRARRGASSVRIEVDDASTQLPVRRDPHELDEHGRGILLVERLALDWGVERRDDGKTIWFELATTPSAPSATGAPTATG
jgi:serine phosphatase RsbU (regulator of sigma subunit)/anti-sigma regulatory factor (Ser/Thr protein kinase)